MEHTAENDALAQAWDEGHAAAHGYDLSYPLDREEWEEEYPDRRNPYRVTPPGVSQPES